jgi:hypothetical protein
VIATHYAPNPTTGEAVQAFLDKIRASYDGPAELAKDLARY